MAIPDDVTVLPPVVIAGRAPGAPVVAPLDGRLGTADGVVAAALPGCVSPTPTSRPAAMPRTTPTLRNRGAVDMASTPPGGATAVRSLQHGRRRPWPAGSSARRHGCLLYTSPSPRDGLLSR